MDSQEDKEVLTDEELKKKAYSLAMQLRRQGLDSEEIFGRLEKQGIPAEIASKALRNLNSEVRNRERKEEETFLHAALIRILAGVAGALIFMIIWPGHYYLPVGIVVGGIVAAVAAKLRMDR